MEVKEPQTWFISGQVYVTPRDAAQYLGLDYDDVLRLITDGELPAVRIEARQLIELDTLKAYKFTG